MTERIPEGTEQHPLDTSHRIYTTPKITESEAEELMRQQTDGPWYNGPDGGLRKAYDILENSATLLGDEEGNSWKVVGLLEEAQALIHDSTAIVRTEIAQLRQDKAELVAAATQAVDTAKAWDGRLPYAVETTLAFLGAIIAKHRKES